MQNIQEKLYELTGLLCTANNIDLERKKKALDTQISYKA